MKGRLTREHFPRPQFKRMETMKMDSSMSTKPKCIHGDDIGEMAAQGVQRALAARHAVEELSMEEAGQVGGALLLKFNPIIYGGLISPISKLTQLSLPALSQPSF